MSWPSDESQGQFSSCLSIHCFHVHAFPRGGLQRSLVMDVGEKSLPVVWDPNLHFYIFIKGALDKFNIIPQLFPIPLKVLAWEMTACRVLRSRLTYFWRYMNISSIFYFSKSTSINTQYSSLWDTLKMMLFTKYLIKWKHIGRISRNFRY